jgi:hypothetical protein
MYKVNMTVNVKDKYLSAFDLAQKSEAAIYELVALEITGKRFASGNDTEEDNRDRVRKWWSDHRTILRTYLCIEQLRFLHDPAENIREKSLIIAAVADCLAGVVLGISPLTAATLVVSFGLRKLCEE